jgi:hypothetical protein
VIGKEVHLLFFYTVLHLATGWPFTGIILYFGEYIASFGDGMLAVPFGAMWE